MKETSELFNYPELVFAVSEKKDGPMKISEKQTRIILKNRDRFFTSLGLDSDVVISGEIVHGNNVAIIGRQNLQTTLTNTDALVTDQRGIFLAITVADCLPIFLFDPINEVVAIVHAGWRGLKNNIIEKTIGTMTIKLNSKSSDIIAYIGPAIGSCHFEVKSDLEKIFKTNYPKAVIYRDDKIFINLKLIARQQLLSQNLNQKNIFASVDCTYCKAEKFYSFRRDKTQPVKTMVALIGLKKGASR
ncbi:MAG: peptidoglycan editing factor PgeF [Patescibacteria group bacterium]|nr:peptidoglycan editing factor PgeF [Patescibacteria group bacterium]